MKASIIAIGDELLIGRTQDSNSSWMALHLDEAGYQVHQIRVIGDTHHEITTALDDALAHSSMVLITGGLGPTRDDLTKDVLNKYFDGTLELNTQALEDIKALFAARGREVTPTNEAQAMIPDVCEPIRNTNGTAPGMWFERKGKVVVSMPGVPMEMRAMFSEQVIERLQQTFKPEQTVHRHVLTIGIPESHLADQLADFEDGLPGHIKLAYLPTFQIVKLRLTANGADTQAMEEEVNGLAGKLGERLGHKVWGYDSDTQEGVIGNLCTTAGLTIGTAESCTAGYIGHTITRVPGSSTYYKGSIVSYANEIKATVLGVDQANLDKYGAVSEEVALDMVRGAQSKLNVDVAVAVTGIAGPDGGTPDKPVGTVWIAIAYKGNVTARLHRFGTDRMANIQRTTMAALEMVRRQILGIE